jgi:hypothetical protein
MPTFISWAENRKPVQTNGYSFLSLKKRGEEMRVRGRAGCSSVLEQLSSTCEALGSITKILEKMNNGQRDSSTWDTKTLKISPEAAPEIT